MKGEAYIHRDLRKSSLSAINNSVAAVTKFSEKLCLTDAISASSKPTVLNFFWNSGQKVEQYRQDVKVQCKKLIHGRISKSALPRLNDLSDASFSKHRIIIVLWR